MNNSLTNNVVNFTIKRLEQLVIKTGWLENLIAHYSKVGNAVFFEQTQFPWTSKLEENWSVIRQELEQVMQSIDELPNFQDISKRQYKISNDNLWKTYFFCAFGFEATKNCERCPKTTQLLKEIPGLKVAFFSILAPGKHIPKHRGKHKGVIRYHLGLIVPEPAEKCWIQVDEQTAHWQEGKSLIFDDTFYHEVWNKTDGYRVVLFLDIARPLRFPVSLLNWVVNRMITSSSIVQEAKLNHEQWEEKFETTM